MQNRRNEMDLGIEQKRAFIEFINKKWASPQQCPICKAQRWVISDYIYSISEINFSPSNSRKMQMTPLIELICGNCGYTLLFNAILAGIYEDARKALDEVGRTLPSEDVTGKK